MHQKEWQVWYVKESSITQSFDNYAVKRVPEKQQLNWGGGWGGTGGGGSLLKCQNTYTQSHTHTHTGSHYEI